MSSQSGSESSANSSRVVDILNQMLNLSPRILDNITLVVRKAAHFTEYLILCGLTTCTYKSFKGKKLNVAFVLLVCLLVAVSDEFLQGFIPGRSSEVRDVLIDFSGAITFLIGYSIYYFITKRKKNKRFTMVN